ncbi:MAG: electron transport complex subunit RsxC [Gammaproteobacteria bacterium]|nr:electron transport complex subunit RsxC [Gammaproteobacteria bacterium]
MDQQEKIMPRRFRGGLKLLPNKIQSTLTPIRQVPIPEKLILPVSQHIGREAIPLVQPGDTVLKGQAIAAGDGTVSAPVHASTSGTIESIGMHPVPHPGGLSALCIVLKADGKDQAMDTGLACLDYLSLSPEEIQDRIRSAGITGLGGAMYPTAAKMAKAEDRGIKDLIINAAECEPLISCDDMLIREHADELITGIQIMLHAISAPRALIGIERDKRRAIDALEKALARIGDDRIRLRKIYSIYPAGGERQLVQVLTGQEVPFDGYPQDVGYLSQNVGTALAVKQALIDGQPLISRITTVAGKGVHLPGNLEVRLGTPIADLIAACGGYRLGAEALLMGGPMMGFSLTDDQLPVVKGTNCIAVAGPTELEHTSYVMPCIRCGKCAQVCPVNLQPQELFWQVKGGDLDKAALLSVGDCIECGCCDYVCPSHIPLTQYFRYAKAELSALDSQHDKSQVAKHRFENRETRLRIEEEARQARLTARKKRLADANPQEREQQIADSVQRAQEKTIGTDAPGKDPGR